MVEPWNQKGKSSNQVGFDFILVATLNLHELILNYRKKKICYFCFIITYPYNLK